MNQNVFTKYTQLCTKGIIIYESRRFKLKEWIIIPIH